MKLLRNRVLVKILTDEQVSPGGLFIPRTVETLPTVKAEVLLLGTSRYGEWWMKEGDIVNIDAPQWAKEPMHPIEHEGQRCLIVNENDINFVI